MSRISQRANIYVNHYKSGITFIVAIVNCPIRVYGGINDIQIRRIFVLETMASEMFEFLCL